jgi:hypothetical protein
MVVRTVRTNLRTNREQINNGSELGMNGKYESQMLYESSNKPDRYTPRELRKNYYYNLFFDLKFFLFCFIF